MEKEGSPDGGWRQKWRTDVEGHFTPFPSYKYNYLMMDHESLNKIKTTRKPESRQFNQNECSFFTDSWKALKRGNSSLGAGPVDAPTGERVVWLQNRLCSA